jgi:ACS family hexuronate transporter-like MFS transporter
MEAETQMTAARAHSGLLAGRYRWVICGMLFLATVINYVDRQMLGVLKPTLDQELGWSQTDYADIVFWFQAAYAASYLVFGRFVDKVGARWGYAAAFLIWNIAHILHGAARSLGSFIFVRIMLGIGEGGNFPSGLKGVTEWFPARERALATGIFNAGANVGAIVTPLIVPIITLSLGWQAAFIITGVVSFLWLFAWIAIYRRPEAHKRVSKDELALIQSDPPDKAHSIPWVRLLSVKETWAYAAGKFMIDPIWWMFLFWLPDFFARTYHLDLKTFGPPLVVVYLLSDVGSVFGGWFSSFLMHRGISANRARKTAMLICALAVLPVVFAQHVTELWLAVAIVGLATAAHQGFSANLYTLPSDVFPRAAVASVIGIGGTVGAIGGMLMAKYAGWVLDTIGSYTPLFIVAGCAYLIALAIVHLLSPRLAPARVD